MQTGVETGRKDDTEAPTGDFALEVDEWKGVWLECENVKSIAMKSYGAKDLTEKELGKLIEVLTPERKQNVKKLEAGVQKIRNALTSPTLEQKELLKEIDLLMELGRPDQAASKLSRKSTNIKGKYVLFKNMDEADKYSQLAIDDGAGLIAQTFKIKDKIFILSGGNDDENLYGANLKNDNVLKKAFPKGYVRLDDGIGGHWTSHYFNGSSVKKHNSLNGTPLEGGVTQTDGINCGLYALHDGMLLAKIHNGNAYKEEDIKKDKEDFCRMMVDSEKYITHSNVAEQVGNWRVGTVAKYPQLESTLKNAKIRTKEVNMRYHNEYRNFYFSQVDNAGSSDTSAAYIDTNYHHYEAYKQDTNYKLQTTIDKHTKIITNGLIEAYKEAYGKGTVDFAKIQEIWKEAQNEKEWKKLREKYQGGRADEKEINKLKFSARFQKKMQAAGLMTGNPNAKNFVGMRLKRVSKYHIDALEISTAKTDVGDHKHPMIDMDKLLLSHNNTHTKGDKTPLLFSRKNSVVGETAEINKFLDKTINDKNPLQAGEASCLGNMEALCTAFDEKETKDKYIAFLTNLHKKLASEQGWVSSIKIDESPIYGACAGDIKKSLALFALDNSSDDAVKKLTQGMSWSYITIDEAAKLAHEDHKNKKQTQSL